MSGFHFDPAEHRPRRHSPGAVEIRYNCPAPGGHDGKRDRDGCLTFNRLTGLWYCHHGSCHASGRAEGYTFVPNPKEPALSVGGVEPVPEHAHALFKVRGLDALYTIRRYRLAWREQRLLWPADPGYAARATVPGQEPKQLCVDGFSASAGSLIGAHLLREGAAVVVVEGDFKAASIPVPWIGVGVEGKFLHPVQMDRILLSRPAEVTLALDGGVPVEVPSGWARTGLRTRCVRGLPFGRGPDDVPMRRRVELLLAAEEL